MKRYLAWSYDPYNWQGPDGDFVGDFAEHEEAVSAAKAARGGEDAGGLDGWDVLDTQTGKWSGGLVNDNAALSRQPSI
jgi:hypothetical protein